MCPLHVIDTDVCTYNHAMLLNTGQLTPLVFVELTITLNLELLSASVTLLTVKGGRGRSIDICPDTIDLSLPLVTHGRWCCSGCCYCKDSCTIITYACVYWLQGGHW